LDWYIQCAIQLEYYSLECQKGAALGNSFILDWSSFIIGLVHYRSVNGLFHFDYKFIAGLQVKSSLLSARLTHLSPSDRPMNKIPNFVLKRHPYQKKLLLPRYCCAKERKHRGTVTNNESAGAIERFQYLSWRDDK
jgi:hypothetical protein